MLKISMDMFGMENLKEKIGLLSKESATVVANIAAEEFVKMLYEAPQFSGNYVANMVIQGGDRARGSAKEYFPIPESVEEAVKKGSLPAINKAMSLNEGLVDQAAGHISNRRGAWMKTITIFNKLDYAEKVDARDHLRKENAGGEHAVTKMMDRLESRSKETIMHGSAEYIRLANSKIL